MPCEGWGPNPALEFLRAWFGEPSEGHIIAWVGDDKTSRWYPASELERFADDSLKLAERANVYFGLATQPKPLGEKQRGPAATAAGIGGLWVEVDFGADGHKKGELPPTHLDALAVVHSFPLAPTFVNLSGHGLHAYWLFREFWQFDSEEERRDAADLVYRFQATIRERCAERGWEMDSTHDLARVLRLPGTWNRKPGLEPIRVQVIEEDLGCRYGPDEFEPYLLDVDWSRRNRGAVSAVQLPDDLPHVDIDQLPVRDQLKRLVRQGPDPKRHASYSEAQWAALLGLVEDGRDDATIAGLFFDPRNEIGLRAREKGRRWFAQDLARARERIGRKAAPPHTWPKIEQVPSAAIDSGRVRGEEMATIPAARLRELLATEARSKQLEVENQRLRKEIGLAVRREKVIANQHLQGAAKVVSVVAVREVMARARRAAPGESVPVNFGTISRRSGVNEKAVSATFKALCGPNGPLVEAKPDWLSTDPLTGEPYPIPRRVNRYELKYRTEEEMLEALAGFEPEKADGKKSWGGKREKVERILEATCPEHPGAGTDVRCRECDLYLATVRPAEGPRPSPSGHLGGMEDREPPVVSKNIGHLGGMGPRRRWFEAMLPVVDPDCLERATSLVLSGEDMPDWVRHGDWTVRDRWERRQWDEAAATPPPEPAPVIRATPLEMVELLQAQPGPSAPEVNHVGG